MADLLDSAFEAANAIIGDLAVPYALITTADRSIGGIVFDVTIREVLSDESVITFNPTETGTPVTDHVFDQPSVIEIVAASSDSTAGGPGYVQALYQDLLALKASKQVFDVSTGKRQYSGMLFSNIVVTTDETSEFALMVTARLQQVLTTDVSGGSAVGANTGNPSLAPTVDMGNQTLQPAPNASLYADYENQSAPSASLYAGYDTPAAQAATPNASLYGGYEPI